MTQTMPQGPRQATDTPGLADAIRHWAHTRPDSPACTFVDFGRDPAGTRHTATYAELDRRARAVAAAVREVAEPGDRVALLLPQGLDYVTAFAGCLYAGVLAVPLYAPELRSSDTRLVKALGDARPALSLTDTASRHAVERMASTADAAIGAVLAVDAVDHDPVAEPTPTAHHDPAYLQYTSGSTSDPAGVVVTHGNLWSGAEQLRSWVRLRPDEAVAAWVPFFHDMGLMMSVALPLYSGAHTVFTSPYAFVQRPARWLRMMSEYRAVLTMSPNFGLDLAARRVPERDRATLDLSALRLVCVGAEPVREPSLRAFTEAFAPAGFSADSLSPGYGLAEATLMVSGVPLGVRPPVLRLDRTELAAGRVREAESADEAVTLVGCGLPWRQEVRVVDPQTGVVLPPDTVGELWVYGPNVAAGYHGRPGRTTETFGAWPIASDGAPVPRPADEDPAHPGAGWLRTGDLGFLRDGTVHVAGRLKDLIIVRGDNHHPTDLEQTVEAALPQARPSHVAAFQVDDPDGTGVVVVAELEARRAREVTPTEALAEVRRAIAARHGIEVSDIVLTRPGKIPTTTSGKLQRGACARRYRDGLDGVIARLEEA